MKRFPKLLLIVVLVAVIGFSLAACKDGGVRGGGPVLTIQNNTGYTIWYVFISLSSASSIGDDWLGPTEVISKNSSRNFTLPSTGTYNIALVDSDIYAYIKMNVSITGNKTVTFTMSDCVGPLYSSAHNEKMDLLNQIVPDLPNKN